MRAIRSMMATLLVAVMACLPLLGSNGAMLLPVSGGVQVNGQPLAAAGTSIAAGDQVALDARGTARMVIPGGTVIAAAKTNFRLEKNQAVRLGYGMLKVAGNVPVILNTRSVVPASSNARYIVTALNGPVYVQAVSGTVLIRRGGASYTVKSGTAAMFQDTNAAPAQAQTPDQNAPAATPPPDQNAPAATTQTQTQTTTTTDQNAAPAQTATPEQNPPAATPPPEQNPPATTQTTTTEAGGTQTTTTTTTATQQPAPTGLVSPTVAVPVAIGIAAAAAAVTGIITYEVTKCDNCITSPSQ